jgi:hypothetical protein
MTFIDLFFFFVGFQSFRNFSRVGWRTVLCHIIKLEALLFLLLLPANGLLWYSSMTMLLSFCLQVP